MRRNILILGALALPFLAPLAGAESPPDVQLAEVVVDPLHDWNLDGKLTASDEFVELVNAGGSNVSLAGWRIVMNDTTPVTQELSGSLAPAQRLALVNPSGEINNNGHVALLDPDGGIVDEVRFGTWAASKLPGGAATNDTDESLARVDGLWRKWHATPGTANEAPRWETTTVWSATPIRGYVPPNATGRVSARAITAATRYNSLDLVAQTGNSSTHVATVAAGVMSDVPAIDGSYAWSTPDGKWRVALAPTRVDALPPILSVPSEAWMGANATFPLQVVDEGVAGVEIQSQENGTDSGWSPPGATIGDAWADGDVHFVRWRARDAFGNTGPWSQNATFRVDRMPPAAPVVRVSAGFNVSWSLPEDVGSPVVGSEVRRTSPNAAAWSLGTNATSVFDAIDPGSEELSYEVWAVDQAGNQGEHALVDVDHPGLHPTILGIRVLKPYWRTGAQEIRVDFDRKMNVTRPLDVTIDGVVDEQRWFANATTFYVMIEDVEAWSDGSHEIVVQSATSAEGHALRSSARAGFRVDRTPPELAVTPAPGWTNAEQLQVDAQEATITWRMWPTGAHEPDAWQEVARGNVSVALPDSGNWTLKVLAKDVAGNTRTWRGEYRVDHHAPNLTLEPGAVFGKQRILVADDGSGVDWASATLDDAEAWSLRVDRARRALWIEPAAAASSGRAHLTVRDLAGNEDAVDVSLLVTPRVDAAATNGTEVDSLAMQWGGQAAQSDAMDPPTVDEKEQWWPFGLAGAAAVTVPLVRHVRRRPRRACSFAARIRALRAAEGAA